MPQYQKEMCLWHILVIPSLEGHDNESFADRVNIQESDIIEHVEGFEGVNMRGTGH